MKTIDELIAAQKAQKVDATAILREELVKGGELITPVITWATNMESAGLMDAASEDPALQEKVQSLRASLKFKTNLELAQMAMGRLQNKRLPRMIKKRKHAAQDLSTAIGDFAAQVRQLDKKTTKPNGDKQWTVDDIPEVRRLEARADELESQLEAVVMEKD